MNPGFLNKARIKKGDKIDLRVVYNKKGEVSLGKTGALDDYKEPGKKKLGGLKSPFH